MPTDQEFSMDFDRTAADAEFAQDFEIGVCDASMQVYARIIMRGADGVRRIESEMADMGYESVHIGTSAQLRGCDMLMVRRPAEPALSLR
jgi:hypothetical protein